MICKTCNLDKHDSSFPKWKNTSKSQLEICKQCHNKRRNDAKKAKGETQRIKNRECLYRWRNRMKEEDPSRLNGSRAWVAKNPLRGLYKRMKGGAASRGYSVHLTLDEFIDEVGGEVPKICPVLGIPLEVNAGGKYSANSPSVDRIDNTKPYQKGNIAIISYKANMIKNIGTAYEHRKIAEWMEKMTCKTNVAIYGGSGL